MALRAFERRSSIHFARALRELRSQSVDGAVELLSAGVALPGRARHGGVGAFATSGTNTLRNVQAKTLWVRSWPTWKWWSARASLLVSRTRVSRRAGIFRYIAEKPVPQWPKCQTRRVPR